MKQINPAIRLATLADAPAIQAIYAPVVRDTIISFEFEPPPAAEMEQRIAKIMARFPWLVAEQNGEVVGYAYAGQHRERAAYQWSVDVSAYVHEQWRGKGVGRALYDSLFALLRRLGYYNVYAGITLPNPASVALHEAMGLKPVGIYRQVGYKMSEWHDVGWWQGSLQPRCDQPQSPRSVDSLSEITLNW